MTVLARRPEGLSMSLLTRKLMMPRTSVLRMLATLEHYGLATKVGRAWRFTDLFYEWSSRSSHDELRSLYRPIIHGIACEVGELVELGVSDSRTVRYIYWEQGTQPGVLEPIRATVAPLHKTACGKLFISQQPTLAHEFSSQQLRAEISAALETGVAWNRRESDPNVIAVATWAAQPSAASPVICVKWPSSRFTEAKGERALAVVRRELARLHG
jgi:DNA-binding IclR family transcriptional regulator